MSNPSITADKTPWYQWDTGLTVTVSGGEMNECHFANRKQGTAYVQAVINGIARVPDELLQVAAPIKAYGYVSDGEGGQTYVEQTFDVIARNIPSDYTYTKTAQKTIRDAEVARDEAVKAAKDAKASELAADDSAVEASNSAQSAGESASAATTSAINAAKSAGEAAKSASDAKAAAGKAVEDASELLNTYTDNAKTSADNAANSARNAADAASAASGSASAAEQSATNASNANAAAQNAKAEAEASKGEAAASASNAAESATAAAKSASDAAASVGAINVISPKSVNISATSHKLGACAFGNDTKAGAEYAVALGNGANASAYGALSIGRGTISSGRQGIAFGTEAKSRDDFSVAIGYLSETSKAREISVGRPVTSEFGGMTREISNVSTPTAPTSASTKKYADDNDAKTLDEAKKYTDDNTSNALVGTVSGKLLHVEDAWPSKPISVTIDGAYKQDGTPSPDNPVPITVIENPVLKITGADTSSAGTSLPITLPPEHPYLAKLPDGTCDTIEIDRYGNATLVARTYKTTLDRWFDSGDNYYAHTLQVDWVTNSAATTIGNASAVPIGEAGKIWFGNTNFLIAYNPRENDTIDIINALGIIAYLSQSPVTYPLGKLDIPSLPESISNVWTEAELTTNMSMTYKRDINIAFENLAQAVVAAAAGE